MKNVFQFFRLIIFLCIIVCFTTGQSLAKEFYVSQSGNNSWSGELSEPNNDNTDGPFATLEKARDEVRTFKAQGPHSPGPITVYIRSGIYTITKTLTLTIEDSGNVVNPIFWRSYPGEKVLFVGGKEISELEPVKDRKVLKRIKKSYRQSIIKTDLKTLGITDLGQMDPRSGKKMNLYFQERFMTPARYPNEGWVTITDVPLTPGTVYKGDWRTEKEDGSTRGQHSARLKFDDTRPSTWDKSSYENMWVRGFWYWDWCDQYQKVARIDSKSKEVIIGQQILPGSFGRSPQPFHFYGYRAGQRFYFLNVLEELDRPGEYYIDFETSTLYFWPPASVKSGDLFISILEDPMLSIEDAQYLTVQGIHFTVGRGGAIRTTGGRNITIAGCTFSNFGDIVVVMDGGEDNGIHSCDVYEVAGTGIVVNGGDRKKLTPAGNFAVNNHVHHFARLIGTGSTGITINGVGNLMAHNKVHHSSDHAMGMNGNENIIELNDIHDVLLEINDAGAIHIGRNPSMQGNIIRYNYWHNIGKEEGRGTASVYFDDHHNGNIVFGNVFYKAGIPGGARMGAVYIHAGKYNIIENNIFIECPQAYGETPWKNKEYWDTYFTGQNWELYFRKYLYEEVVISLPPYSIRYPWLPDVYNDERPNVLARNFVYKCELFYSDRRGGEPKLIDNIITDESPGFVDEASGNFMLRDDSWIYQRIPGFQKIPFDKIGLYIDEYRMSLPEK